MRALNNGANQIKKTKLRDDKWWLRLAIAAMTLAAAGLLCLMLPKSYASNADGRFLPLRLDRNMPIVEAWPGISIKNDPNGALTIASIMADPTISATFEMPKSAYATMGISRGIFWLRLPVLLQADSADDATKTAQWILDIDYSLLNRIEVYVVADGKLIQQALLGNEQPFADRPIASRAHAVGLNLAIGVTNEIYLRVETIGATILPITLGQLSAFHERELNEQMLQGVLTSLGLCLLIYSLLQWMSLRETLYLKYALLIFGSVIFSVHFFGIGEQYLWRDHLWIERHLAGISSLVAAGATAMFVEHVLRAEMGRHLRRALKIGAFMLFLAAVIHGMDLIDIQMVSKLMSTLGLLPALLGLPGAIRRMRQGDIVGAYFIVAWVGYFIASAIMVGVVKGHVDANFWTLHSFQFGATLDMLVFMRITVLRSAAIHSAAERANRERDSLINLAQSDPLTGLVNRRGLNLTLDHALQNVTSDKMLAVYLLDLDEFKPVNDQYGHDVGDELLVLVAKRLRATMRSGDVVARLGGDEFVVMASGLQNDLQANELGHKLLEVFNTPFALSKHTCRVGVTIGYALAPHDGDDGVGLMKAADAAMYVGKETGKNCLRRAVAANILPV